MRTYSNYKYSGIRPIGDIPSEWDTVRLKAVFDEVNDRYDGLKDESLPLLSVSEYYGVAERAEKIEDDAILVRASTLDGYKKCKAGDFVSNIMLAWKCAMGKSPKDGIVSPAYCVYRIKPGFNISYYHYLLRTGSYGEIYKTHSTGIIDSRLRLYTDEFFSIYVPVPTEQEQAIIASFLDDKVARIDQVIDEAKASIEEYKQWKASIIYEAVTKGLDTDAELVDSGVGWIGNIPKGWHVCKTLYALAMPITDGPHTTPDLFDEGIPFVSAEAVSCGNGKIAFDHIRGYISEEFYEECCLKYIPQRDDIYMIKSGATTGKVSYVDTDIKFTIWSPLAVFRANKAKMYFKYLFYFLQSDAYQKQVQLGWTYGTQQNIGMRTLETLKICMPSMPEQHAIADALDEKCGTIDSLVSEKEALISDLEAYKKSLIFEVVTGKRKVV